MNENKLPQFVSGPSGRIEYDFIEAKQQAELGQRYLAVVCHPHPLHGGTKDNKVVHTLCRALRDIGISCLRFNFRGVGQSDGSFDEGRGELDDLRSVIDFARTYIDGDLPIIVCGFSFGAFIASQYASMNNPAMLLLVAPPVSYPQFDCLDRFPCPVLVIQGRQDEVIEFKMVESWVSGLESECEFRIINDASHFFHGKLPDLKNHVQEYVLNQAR